MIIKCFLSLKNCINELAYKAKLKQIAEVKYNIVFNKIIKKNHFDLTATTKV